MRRYWKTRPIYPTRDVRPDLDNNRKDRDMLRKIIAYKECVARDITIKHLSNKLARLADATRQPNATQADFYNHNRVRIQLDEARNYLC